MKWLAGVVLALVAAIGVGGPAQAQRGAVNEGDDLQHCATYDESGYVNLGEDRRQVTLALDTPGRVVPVARFDRAAGALSGGRHAIHPALSQVRKYRTCAEDGQPAEFYVEFNATTNRVWATIWI